MEENAHTALWTNQVDQLEYSTQSGWQLNHEARSHESE